MPNPTCPDLDTLLHMGLPLTEELLRAAGASNDAPAQDCPASN